MTTAEAAKPNTDAAKTEQLIADVKTEEVKTEEAKTEVKTEEKTEAPAKAEASADGKTEIKLKLPEGSLLDAKAVEDVSAFAKANGLAPEKAQALLERESKLVATKAEEQTSQWNKITSGWIDVAKADKEIGGESFGKNVELAKRVIEKFATAEFKKELVDSGYGNYPELIRFVHRIGKAMSADTWVQAGAVPPPQKSAAEVFYGPDKKEENAGQ